MQCKAFNLMQDARDDIFISFGVAVVVEKQYIHVEATTFGRNVRTL